jgi:hypothetical protein
MVKLMTHNYKVVSSRTGDIIEKILADDEIHASEIFLTSSGCHDLNTYLMAGNPPFIIMQDTILCDCDPFEDAGLGILVVILFLFFIAAIVEGAVCVNYGL